tara:strand:- start:229 stop:444 length:216 start_codon:yes stop_codon:yes gene_type:complete
MTRTDFPDWPSYEDPPSQRLPAIHQRWWWQQTSDNKISIIDEYGFAVANDLDAATARHIIKVHNRKIGAAA